MCVTGGPGVGKSMLVAALARRWNERSGRNIELVEAPLEMPGLARKPDLIFWVLSGDPAQAGFALGWLRCSRASGGSPIGLVLNRISPDSPKAPTLPGGAAALASLPFDEAAARGEPGEGFLRALSPLLAELARVLGDETEESAAMSAAKVLGVPYASRENRVLEVEAAQGLERFVDERLAGELEVLPLFVDGKTLAVAMADPADEAALDRLRRVTGLELQPFVAPRGQLLAAIDSFYSSLAPPRVDLDRVLTESKDARVITFVNSILKQAFGERASMIVLVADAAGVRLRFEIDGEAYERMPPPPDLFVPIVDRLKILARLDPGKRTPQDGTISVRLQNKAFDLGVAILPTEGGGKVVLRVLEKGKGRR